MAALALAGGDHIIATDAGNDSYAQYVVYKNAKPWKAVLINTEYYSGNGTRSTSSFTLSGLSSQKIKALRMTAASSVVTTRWNAPDSSSGPTIVGMSRNVRPVDLFPQTILPLFRCGPLPLLIKSPPQQDSPSPIKRAQRKANFSTRPHWSRAARRPSHLPHPRPCWLISELVNLSAWRVGSWR